MHGACNVDKIPCVKPSPSFVVLALALVACSSSDSQKGDAQADASTPDVDAADADAAGDVVDEWVDEDGAQVDAPDEGPGELPPPQPLRLVTWNCKDFFDNVKGNCGGCWNYEVVLSKVDYQAKLAEIAQGLRELDGDVVVLQEIENLGVLADLATHALLSDRGYQHRKLEVGNDGRGINLGVMSRVPIEKYVSHKGDEFDRVDEPGKLYKFARDAVEVHVTFNEQKVVILGAHLKARSSDDPPRRIAEAQQVRSYADKLKAADPSRYIFILGDMNDTPTDISYGWIIGGLKPPGSAVYEAAMDWLMPEEQRYSYVYGGARLLIDHIIADPSAGACIDKESPVILHNHAENPSSSTDHDPVAATYQIPCTTN